jgi:ABC-type multidrug transport system ATPase subunit
MSDPLVLRDVRRTYRTEAGELPVLRGADLTLHAGEIVALVAPSGAGKSTLLHLAGLLEKPDGGSVFVEGRDAGALPDAARTAIRRDTIGFVYQFHHLLGEFTALENVVLPQMIAGRSSGLSLVRVICRESCPVASSSGWRSHVRWRTRRRCCWPTNRPATSMSEPRPWCSRNCWRWCGARTSLR